MVVKKEEAWRDSKGVENDICRQVISGTPFRFLTAISGATFGKSDTLTPLIDIFTQLHIPEYQSDASILFGWPKWEYV